MRPIAVACEINEVGMLPGVVGVPSHSQISDKVERICVCCPAQRLLVNSDAAGQA